MSGENDGCTTMERRVNIEPAGFESCANGQSDAREVHVFRIRDEGQCWIAGFTITGDGGGYGGDQTERCSEETGAGQHQGMAWVNLPEVQGAGP